MPPHDGIQFICVGACSQKVAVVLCMRQHESSSWKMPPAAAGADAEGAAVGAIATEYAAVAASGAVNEGASASVAPEGMSESPTAVRAALACAKTAPC